LRKTRELEFFMHPVALPACSCLYLAKELLVLLAPQLPAQVRLARLSPASTLAELGLGGAPALSQLQATLEHRFRLHLGAFDAALSLGELVDHLHQGLSLRAIAPPYLC
jgi:hypothetical protein